MPEHIKFICLFDKTSKIVAQHTHWDQQNSEPYATTATQILSSPGWAALRESGRMKLVVPNGANIYQMERDKEGRAYVVVTTAKYPQAHIFSSTASSSTTPRLMAEFIEFVASNAGSDGSGKDPDKHLKKPLKGFLKTLAAKYDDVDNVSKIAAAARRVAEVQSVMADNMRAATERDNLLGNLDDKTRALNASAKKLFEGSQAVKRGACRQCCAAYVKVIIIIVLLLVLAGGAIVAVNYTTTHWWGGDSGSGGRRLLRGLLVDTSSSLEEPAAAAVDAAEEAPR